MGKHLRDFHAAFPMSAKFKRTWQQYIVIVRLMNFDAVWMRLAAPLGQFRFRIEQVHLAGAAILHQLDHRLRRSGEMTRSRSQVAIERSTFLSRGGIGP